MDLYKAIIDNIKEPIFVLDSDGVIVDLNPTASSTLGISQGDSAIQVLDQTTPQLSSILQQLPETPPPEHAITIGTGETQRHFDVSISPLTDSSNHPNSTIVVLHEIATYPLSQEADDQPSANLATLLQVSNAISSTLELEEMIPIIAQHWVKALGVSGCTLSRYDLEADAVITWLGWSSSTVDNSTIPGTVYQLENYPATRYVLESRSPLTVYSKDPDADPAEVAFMQKEGLASLLMLPLVAGEQVIGLVELYDSEEVGFSEADINFCVAMADQVAVAVQNAMRYKELERQFTEQTALGEVGQLITSSLDLDTILSILAEQLTIMLDATSAYIVSYDPDTNISCVRAEYFSPSANEDEQISDINKNFVESATDRLDAGVVFQYHIDDPDITEAEREHLRAYGGQTVLEIPVQVKDQTIAYAEIWDSRKKREFTPRELNLCRSIAQQAAVAMQNAHLFNLAQQEISEREKVEEILRHQAFHDPLTGLPNRALFTEYLEHAIARTNRDENYLFAVMFLDLDRFKNINDTRGHDAGDKYLIEVANRIKSCIRNVDTVARMGGDEFVCLLDSIESVIQATNIAQRIQDSLNVPFELDNYELKASVSIGIVTNSNVYRTHEEYLRDADIAMRRAKTRGKGVIEVFDKTMRQHVLRQVAIENDLQRAIENQEFVVHYQPIIRLDEGDILGFEALLRWQHPVKGFLSPSGFLNVAEEVGSIVPINLWVISQSHKQLENWQEEYGENFPEDGVPWTISVNISNKLLNQPALVDELRQTTRHTQPEFVRLVLEITESALIEDTNTASFTLLWLRELGFDIHLDDFGTGYSSLSHLIKLPIDSIKIDRSFVAKMNSSMNDARLVRTTILMAHELGKTVIAEGIETKAQLTLLKEWGCDYGQGFLFSKPKDPDELRTFISEVLTEESAKTN
jgi:diguanylate cyclase (GGDEF)-like protein